MKKYKMVKEDKLYRIVSLRDTGILYKGQEGGLVENDNNLSQDGTCWISRFSEVTGNAMVFEDSRVFGVSQISGDAQIYGNASIIDSKVYGIAEVFGYASARSQSEIFDSAGVQDSVQLHKTTVCGTAYITGIPIMFDGLIKLCQDYIIIGPIGSRDGYTTAYRDKNGGLLISCGCFNNSLSKFIQAIKDTHYSDGDVYKSYMKACELFFQHFGVEKC